MPNAVAVGVVWYCSGLGYVMSVMLEPQNSMVASVAIVLVLGGFFNGVEPRFRTLTPTMKTVFGEPLATLRHASGLHFDSKNCSRTLTPAMGFKAGASCLCTLAPALTKSCQFSVIKDGKVIECSPHVWEA